MANDKSQAGRLWVSEFGKNYVEVQRCGEGASFEVQLSPEESPGLRAWYNASEIESEGLSPVMLNSEAIGEQIERLKREMGK